MRAISRGALGAAIIWGLSIPAAGAPFGPSPERVGAGPVRTGTEVVADPDPAPGVRRAAPGRVDPSSKPIGPPRSGDAAVDESDETDRGEAPRVFGIGVPDGLVRTVGALGGVLALIFALAHGARRLARSNGTLAARIGAGGDAPSGVVEVLGRYPLGRGQSLVVMRFGRRVLLLSNSAASGRSGVGGMTTLCELGDSEEVASIMRRVAEARGETSSARFERTLHEVGSATDDTILRALAAQRQAAARQRPGGAARRAPGVLSNDEGDRFELTGSFAAPGAAASLKRRLGALRRGGGA